MCILNTSSIHWLSQSCCYLLSACLHSQQYFILSATKDMTRHFYSVGNGLVVKPSAYSEFDKEQPSAIFFRQHHTDFSASISLSFLPQREGEKAGIFVGTMISLFACNWLALPCHSHLFPTAKACIGDKVINLSPDRLITFQPKD